MSASRYRVSINGFWCRNETWDDVFNWDGKHDEVFLSVNTKVVDANGTVLDNLNSESELLGDTWRLPGRVQAGSASDRGGIVSGDKFPWDRPMIRQDGVNTTVRVPPYVIWEGDLPADRMVFLTPTIWEWDPGVGAWDGWLAWQQQQTDETYGERAKDIFGSIWPVSRPVFDAVSLGIQTFASLAGLWSPLGRSMRRPIGIQRDPADPDGSLFNPVTIALGPSTADYLVTTNPQGLGEGIRELVYADDPYLRGVYSVFVQVEAIGGGVPATFLQSDWRWCDKCQGLFFGGGLGDSDCPAGGTHADPAQSGSGDYSLPHNAPASPSRQSEWRWCDRCQGLFYGPAVADSLCPTGGTHAPPAQSGSGNYGLPHDVPASPGMQSDWRWCSRCQGLFFAGGAAAGSCPAGGGHALPAQSGSWNYSLPHG